ncbi:MAG: arylesterase [Gemmatimonadota bacterium]|nr:arylesterase [Gemmatimonadota bacterium]
MATLAACREDADLPGTPPTATPPEAGERESAGTPRVVFIGTSLTAGYGLDDPDLAFPAVLGRRMTAAGQRYRVVNAGVSGDTSAGGGARLANLLEQHGSRLAVLFVELGANDGLRGQSPEALHDNLSRIVRETRHHRPHVGIVLAGMRAPTNLGTAYTEAFRAVFPRIAEENEVLLIPFLLEGVAAVPSLNQPDGIHPNAEGHQAVASHVWSLLGGYLAARCKTDGAC